MLESNHWLGSIWVFQKMRAPNVNHEKEVYDWINIESADWLKALKIRLTPFLCGTSCPRNGKCPQCWFWQKILVQIWFGILAIRVKSGFWKTMGNGRFQTLFRWSVKFLVHLHCGIIISVTFSILTSAASLCGVEYVFKKERMGKEGAAEIMIERVTEITL